MRKFFKWFLVLLILALIVLMVFDPKLEFNWLSSNDNAEASSGQPTGATGGFQRQTLDVLGTIIKAKPLINKISVTGEVIPNEHIQIKPEISGIVKAIYFREGQYVKKGELLVRINVDELIAQREKLKYTEQLRQSVEERQAKLLKREAISQEEYDEALTELKTTGADINLINTQIKKSEIRAPFNGRIGLREISQGAYITPSTVIAPLYNINPVKIEFAIPGKYSNEVNVGAEVDFTTEVSKDVFTGKVYAVDSQVDPNTRTLKMRARCPNPNGLLLPGQFARIQLELGRNAEALMVPTESVIPELGGSKLLLIKKGKVTESKVTTGIRTENELEITSGVSAGDTVLTTGILQAQPGTSVNVKIKN